MHTIRLARLPLWSYDWMLMGLSCRRSLPGGSQDITSVNDIVFRAFTKANNPGIEEGGDAEFAFVRQKGYPEYVNVAYQVPSSSLIA